MQALWYTLLNFAGWYSGQNNMYNDGWQILLAKYQVNLLQTKKKKSSGGTKKFFVSHPYFFKGFLVFTNTCNCSGTPVKHWWEFVRASVQPQFTPVNNPLNTHTPHTHSHLLRSGRKQTTEGIISNVPNRLWQDRSYLNGWDYSGSDLRHHTLLWWCHIFMDISYSSICCKEKLLKEHILEGNIVSWLWPFEMNLYIWLHYVKCR